MPKIFNGKLSWLDHKKTWNNCKLCKLCKGRSNVVLLRGSIPADVLFVGEAPGVSDDVLGKPFSGPVGKYLDQVWEEALEEASNVVKKKLTFTCAYTHLVACLPKEEGKWRNPSQEEFKACSTRFKEVVKLTQPNSIVNLGKTVAKNLPADLKELSSSYSYYPARYLSSSITVYDPLTILNSALEVRGILHQNTVVSIRDILLELISRD